MLVAAHNQLDVDILGAAWLLSDLCAAHRIDAYLIVPDQMMHTRGILDVHIFDTRYSDDPFLCAERNILLSCSGDRHMSQCARSPLETDNDLLLTSRFAFDRPDYALYSVWQSSCHHTWLSLGNLVQSIPLNVLGKILLHISVKD